MSSGCVLAIDQGTTNTKVLLLDHSGGIVARAIRPLETKFPRPAWVEQDPTKLWVSVQEAIDECLSQQNEITLAAVGITNQRESVLVWEKETGKPAGPCIVWQCRRTAPFCARLREEGLEQLLRERTGLPIDPLFSASKIRWILEQIDGFCRAERGELCVGTVDSWLLWNLTGGTVHACDATNASRTQLLNIRKVAWDDDLLKIFGVSAAALPEVKPSSSVFGYTRGGRRLMKGVPIASLIGDSHAALFGHASFRPGTVKATYGTGSSLMSLTEDLVDSRGLSATIAWSFPERVEYALEGNITVTGGAIQWVGEFLELNDPVRDAARLASQAADTGGVYMVPAFAGLGAPHWNDQARGLITGLTRGTSPAQVARAALESIAFQIRDVFDVMEAAGGCALPSLLADGAASQNDSLIQFQADILGRPVVRSSSADLSAVGAAWLAGLAAGVWSSTGELEQLRSPTQSFQPRMAEAERAQRHAAWQEAVWRAVSRPRELSGCAGSLSMEK